MKCAHSCWLRLDNKASKCGNAGRPGNDKLTAPLSLSASRIDMQGFRGSSASGPCARPRVRETPKQARQTQIVALSTQAMLAFPETARSLRERTQAHAVKGRIQRMRPGQGRALLVRRCRGCPQASLRAGPGCSFLHRCCVPQVSQRCWCIGMLITQNSSSSSGGEMM